jgi:rhodanese-related sulfurtransferase/peroxiredoxin
MLGRARNLLTWPPPEAGEIPHSVSLTADEGTWVKLEDFRDHLNVVFVVFNSITDDEVDQWLQQWSQRIQQFDALETVVFGIHTARTEELRALRHRLGLEFFLLYDPLAIESRALRCSSRIAPVCKTTVFAVGKDGRVIFGERGLSDPAAVLERLASHEGRTITDVGTPEEKPSQAPEDLKRPGAAPAVVSNIDSEAAEGLIDQQDGGYLLVDVRTLSEYEADHSPDAVHIPIDELPHRYRELEQTNRIICVCQAGGRSAAAAEFLTSIGGTEIYNVEGGMSAWAGKRVTGGKSQP